MTARSVTSTVLMDGAPLAGCQVMFDLVTGDPETPGWRADKAHIAGRVLTTTNAQGVWTVDLEPNSGSGIVLPAGTAWRVVEMLDSGIIYYISVPDASGTHQARDLLVSAPTTVTTWASTAYVDAAVSGMGNSVPLGGDLSGVPLNAQIVAGAVGTAELAAGAVTAAKVAADVATQAELDAVVASIGGTAVGGDLTGTVANAQIAALAVGTAELAAGAVTAAKVAADVATQAELDAAVAAIPATVAGAAVGGDLTGTVSNAQIAALAVGTAELAANAVTAAKVAADVATQAELDAAVAGVPATIAGSAVGGDLTGTVANAQIAALAVGTAELAAGAVTAAKVAADVATQAELDAVVAALGTTAVGGDLTGTIANAQLAANSVGAPEIANGSVGLAELASDAKLIINVRDPAYGAVPDARIVSDAAITSGAAILTSATAAFTAADVGKLVTVNGAGAAGAVLASSISGYTNSTTVTLANAAGTTVTGAYLVYGTNNDAAIQAAIDAGNAAGRSKVYFPPGLYGRGGGTVTLKHNVVIGGAAMDASGVIALRSGVRLFDDPGSAPAGSFNGIEDITLWGFGDRTRPQGGDGDRLTMLQAERIWFRRVHAIHSRQMSIAGIGTVEARAENCYIEKSSRDGINFTGSARAVIEFNTLVEIGDDAIAYHVSSGVATGTAVSPQAVITGNRMEKCCGIKVLGATTCAINGNSGQFLIGYGVFLDIDGSEGNKDLIAVNVNGNVFRDIIDNALVGGGTIAFGIHVAGPAPAQGVLSYWPGMTGPGTGTAAVKGPRGSEGDKVGGASTGSYGVNVNGNIILQTLEGLTTFSDAGFGNLWWSDGPVNPTMTGTIYRTGGNISTGIDLSAGALRDVLCQLNTIEGVAYGFLASLMPTSPQLTIRNNKIIRVLNGVALNSAGSDKYGYFFIEGNEVDIDPLFEASEREMVSGQPNGHWTFTAGGTSAVFVYTYQIHGVYITSNTIRNCYILYTDTASTVAFWDNNLISDTAHLGIAFGDPGGVNFSDAHSACNRVIQVESDPRTTTYGRIRSPGHDLTAASIPTTGTYAKGQFVRNRTPLVSAGKVIYGWLRMTNTTTHVAETDWAPIYALTNDASLRVAGTAGNGFLQFDSEQSADPSAPSANRARVFTKDNGSGKTQLCVRFNTGAVVVIATEP